MLSIVDSDDPYPIDGEELCLAMEVSDHYATWLLSGREKSLGKLHKYNFLEGKDFIGISQKSTGGRPKLEIKMAVNCAKKVALKQNSKMGDLVADYFILMETVIKEMDHWIMVREPEKLGYRQLTGTLKSNYMLNNGGEEPHFFIYTEEADMINVALLGDRAKAIRKKMDMDDDITRDHLVEEINQALYELQIVDCALIMGGLNFHKRTEIINKTCEAKYINVKLIAKTFDKVG